MDTDFLDALDRHWSDAETLFQAARFANADHLYGLAAECGLKRLMQAFGMPMDAQGRPNDNPDRVHVNGLWERYGAYRSGHLSGPAYALPKENPFSDWDISQRYAHRDGFSSNFVKPHRTCTEHIKGLVDKARRDGLI